MFSGHPGGTLSGFVHWVRFAGLMLGPVIALATGTHTAGLESGRGVLSDAILTEELAAGAMGPGRAECRRGSGRSMLGRSRCMLGCRPRSPEHRQMRAETLAH